MKQYIRTFAIFMLLLIAGSITNNAWAAKVTYHILTLPINPSYYDYHMKSTVTGHRLEAFKVVVDNQSTVELPAHYKSPLIASGNFKYYKPEDINSGGSAISLYDDVTDSKGVLYKVKGVDTEDPAPTAVAEGTAITTSTAEYYVVYTYNEAANDGSIAKLDGSVNYNIGVKDKGFLSYNRGRNNRPAVVPTAKVDPEMLASPDFSYVENPGNSITTYWSDGNNKNTRDSTESKFFFGFKFEGKDPYHIVVRTSYARNYTYIEQNDDKKGDFVYKWYKGGALFASGTGNNYIASDDHIRYTQTWVNGDPNPQNPTRVAKTGFYHGNKSYWSTVALLNNTSNTGYVFMGTRTVDGNGATPASPYYMKFTGNNLNYGQISAAEATKSHTMNGIYPLKKVTFKIATPFYALATTDEEKAAHVVSVADWVSQYTVENDSIVPKYLPTSLRRKYCNYTGKFYKDALCTQEITYFSDANYDNTEGYKVYIGYNLTSDIPFKGITPASTYTAETWANATWYELTDEASTQVDGLKLKYDGTNFKNNGADNVYDKTTEFAFIGDPYELRVVYRDATSGATPYYVGATGTPPTNETLLTASTTASEGYKWELPDDASAGSFLLRKYKGTGNWYWNPGHPEPVTVSYSTKSHTYNVTTANAQTVTFNVNNLDYTEGDYILVTKGGTNADQVTVTSEKIYVQTGGTASFTAAIKGRGDDDKTFTLSIQKYNTSDVAQGTASVVTVNQKSSTIIANTVQYSTANSTRVKVMTLPTRNFTYNIVDLAGNIAAKATVTQTIYSPLSLLGSVPSVIISPLILDETITFYSTYSGGGRGNLSSSITETPVGSAVSSTNIYVAYTTKKLANKPATLSENQVFNVRLNEYYVYYDKEDKQLKKNASPTPEDLSLSDYLWKLRNRDPYAMLIDNLGAREGLSVTGEDTDVKVYDTAGDGNYTTESREKGAWIKLDGDLPATSSGTAIIFGTDRAQAQRLIAKSSLKQGVYEVMVATNTVDASTTYYNIGSPDLNTVKIYNNSTYAHGNEVLQFFLNQNVEYTYHLIDKEKHELLTAKSKTPDLALPAEYQSPLVATYHFYDQDNITESDGVYTVKASPTELTSLSDLLATATDPTSSTAEAYGAADATHKHDDAVSTADITEKAKKLTVTGNHYFKIGEDYYVVNVSKACYYDIYVTYDANDIVKFNSGQYMLKFLDPNIPKYHLENGNDKLTSSQIQPVYPYCNGDGNLNVYGNEMQKEQFNGGANTRPRWVWYFVSDNSDPYHVSIHSKSTINYKDVSNYTYLTTYVVHFNQDASADTKHVVTGGTLPGIASVDPTEYMVLGSQGNYKLLTTNEINDGTTTERRKVTSLEQYWKTYNMIKLDVLGISKSTDKYSDDPTTWVVPTDQRTTLNTRLETLGVGSGNWHSYNAYANATRWNGYNDKSNGAGKKVVENLEHWFQTFDMGNGTFDIESAEVPPVLVLLDRHGWEIMRRPLPTTSYPEGEELAGLRVYDSPLVDKYYFYSNATKATNCHKYTLRLQDGKERDQIKVNGEHYSSTSLADLPPISATGVKDGNGAFQDQYVIYTVKEEYENNYAYSLDETTSPYTESGISQPYLVVQNGRFYKAENTLAQNASKSYLSKPIIEHTDPEGGNVYDLIVSPHNHHGTNNNIIYESGEHIGEFIGNNFWYVKPNLNIDDEMGIPWIAVTGETTETAAKNKLRKEYKDKTGFDPYNIQLQLVNNNSGTTDGRYLTTHMTSAHLDNGIMVGEYAYTATDADNVDTQAKKLTATGNYYFKQEDAENYWCVNVTTAYDGSTDAEFTKTSGSYAEEWSNSQTTGMKITLEAAGSATVAEGSSEGYDHTDMRITNQTFMAVSDANGNMQLMPRFDHTLRVDLKNDTPWETKLSEPVDHAKASADNNSSMGPQTTFFVCPQRFHYHIIDNYGREALRYKRGADFYPDITDHFKSPVAKDFTYYTGLAEGVISDSNGGEWTAAKGDFKRTLTKESMLEDAVNLLPTSGTYYYRIGTRGNFTWKKVAVAEGKGLSDKEITGSFAEAKVYGVDCDVYVRYDYDLDADLDADRILQGQWYTVKLADKDLQADGKVMTFTRTVAESDYADAKAALPSDGEYYFRIIGESSYSYTKVTRSGGSTTGDVESSESAWTNALGLGVDLYAGEASSRSLTATNTTDLDTQADKLTATGDYYFRVGTDSYTYYKVTVTTAYDGETDAAHTDDDDDDGSKGYATLWSDSQPLVVDADAKKWQWKFFVAPADPTSDYYVKPDPYAIHLFNRYSNYTINPSEEPSPMSVEIKVPNANDGANRFALLSHPNGGYAFVVAKTYSDYSYPFLNGADMTVPNAAEPQTATTVNEAGFNYKTGGISNDSRVVVDNDVKHNYTYYVITNANELAITTTQTAEEAENHGYNPYVPEVAQSPLLNMDDYKYYGFASRPAGKYSVIPQTILYTLSGLYDDNVYVRYDAYSMDKTSFKVPNKRNKTTAEGGTGQVARDPDSHDAAMNIEGKLPYNIIWDNDNMMESSDDSNITDGGSHQLDGTSQYVWYFTGDDPYALKIEHKKTGYYIYTDGTVCSLHASNYTPFMLLRKSGYDYGILQKTGGDKKLTFGDNDHDDETADTWYLDDAPPTKFIIFGLSVHDLIYRLIISRTCKDSEKASPAADQYVEIPCKTEPTGKLKVYGTTQRDLSTTYQLGETINIYDGSATTPYNYCVDAGAVSIGDLLQVPNEFNRPNCTYEFFIDGIWDSYNSVTKTISGANSTLDALYKGEKLNEESPRLMSDAELINKVVRVNIVYSFNKELATNSGMDFVTSKEQNLWYTFETPVGETPYLAQYTNAWGLQAKEGRDTRYTNDYLWTPLGDVYGFRMYNRYMLKNSTDGDKKMMTMSDICEGQNLLLAEPSTPEKSTDYPAGNEIFELVSGDRAGNFRVHPVANTGDTKYYVRRDPSDSYVKLSTTPCDWTFGLDMPLVEPYYKRAGYVGGLTSAGKTAYETAVATGKITEIQKVVYNDEYIVHYSPGYYRLDNQPGVLKKDSVRYASGYLHDIEKTAVSGGIPMHFYSILKDSTTFSTLNHGFTITNATRGELPIAPAEHDPSTVFYFNGTETLEGNPRSTIQTQGLYVAANPMGDTTGADDKKEGKGTNRLQRAVMSDDPNKAITFSLMDIGGAVLLIHDGSAPATRRYLNYDQSNFFQRTATSLNDSEDESSLDAQAKKFTSMGDYYFKVGDNYYKVSMETVYDPKTPTDATYTRTSSTSDEWNKAADEYDLKYYHESPTDNAKWCMQPVQKTSTAGDGEMPLIINTNKGGDGYYYGTFYAPFDVLLPNDGGGHTYYAYFCKTWDDAGLHPTAVPATNTYAEGKFVPAGTPVIIRTTDESDKVTLTLPSSSPTASSITTDLMGEYLEQLLSLDSSHDVYTLGLPFTSAASIDRSTGVVTAPLKESATSGIGFYINATPNKEYNPLQSMWQRNNRYVIHNKVYYRASDSHARGMTRGSVDFVPLIFDLEENKEGQFEDTSERREYVGDGCVYDMQGRRVATEEQVLDGTWKQRVSPGIYIINGKKISVN